MIKTKQEMIEWLYNGHSLPSPDETLDKLTELMQQQKEAESIIRDCVEVLEHEQAESFFSGYEWLKTRAKEWLKNREE